MRSWCREFAERQKMEIDFRSDLSSVLPGEVGLTLFRVLQESMHNAMKYSAAKHTEVDLREEGREVHLIVSDRGKGFDIAAALQGQGLGLTSMRERVRLVNGTLSIDSRPNAGTTIHVRVPFTPEVASGLAVG
jgi:signal transduction histidine kinase